MTACHPLILTNIIDVTASIKLLWGNVLLSLSIKVIYCLITCNDILSPLLYNLLVSF